MKKIALVTPSFNSKLFLEAAICSVIEQKYPYLEYILQDGGSTDGSVEIIEKYSQHFDSWSTEQDSGQYDAINKGFAKTTAPIMGWLNSDDIHLPWTLSIVGEVFTTFPQIRWLTTAFPIVIERNGRPFDCRHVCGFSRHGILRGETLPNTRGFLIGGIQQESTFWRRDLWEQAGGRLETTFDYAADFDLWMRFASHADIYSVNIPLAAFRRHGNQKTAHDMNRYRIQAIESFMRHGKGCSNSWIRIVSRNIIPARLKNTAARLGWLYPTQIVRQRRDTGCWWIEKTLT